MKKLIIYILSFFVSTASASTSSESKEFSASGLQNLILKNHSGDVKVSVSDDEQAYVFANKVNFKKNCTLKMERVAESLVLEVEKSGWFNTGKCEVHFEIKVPREISLDLKNGSGDIEVNGTKGQISYSLGSGNLNVKADVDKLEGKSGSGSINVIGTIGYTDIKMGSGSLDLTGLTSDAYLKTGSGDLNIKYESVPEKGELDIKAGSGDSTISLPSTAKVLTSFISGSGRVYNELGDSSDASFRVSMKAGSGDLNIKKL